MSGKKPIWDGMSVGDFGLLIELSDDSKAILEHYPKRVTDRQVGWRYPTDPDHPLFLTGGLFLLGRFDLCVHGTGLFDTIASAKIQFAHWQPWTQNIFENTLQACEILGLMLGWRFRYSISGPTGTIDWTPTSPVTRLQLGFTDMETVGVSFEKRQDALAIEAKIPERNISVSPPPVSFMEFRAGLIQSARGAWRGVAAANREVGKSGDFAVLDDLLSRLERC